MSINFDRRFGWYLKRNRTYENKLKKKKIFFSSTGTVKVNDYIEIYHAVQHLDKIKGVSKKGLRKRKKIIYKMKLQWCVQMSMERKKNRLYKRIEKIHVDKVNQKKISLMFESTFPYTGNTQDTGNKKIKDEGLKTTNTYMASTQIDILY